MVIRIKSRIRKSHKRIIGTTRCKTNRLKKGVSRMTPINYNDINNNFEKEFENANLDCVIKIREIAQKAIKEKGLTNKQIRMSLGMKKYEK